MTAFIARNATESVGIIESQSNPALTNWTYNLAKEYMSIDAGVYSLPGYVS